jgi:hypothetical protein
MNYVENYKHSSRFYITSLTKKLKEEGFCFMGVLYMLIGYLNGMYYFYTNLKVFLFIYGSFLLISWTYSDHD